MTFTWLDWGFVAILAMCVLMGVVRGLIREGLGLVVWIVALLVARAFCVETGALLTDYIENALLRTVVGFVIVAFGVIVAGGLCMRFLNAVVSWAGMGSFNRVLGGVFGAVKGAVIIALIGVLIPLTPVAETPAWQQAALRPTVSLLQAEIATRYQQLKQGQSADHSGLPDEVESLDNFSQTVRN